MDSNPTCDRLRSVDLEVTGIPRLLLSESVSIAICADVMYISLGGCGEIVALTLNGMPLARYLYPIGVHTQGDVPHCLASDGQCVFAVNNITSFG
jgi:hypothetical protein